MCEWVYLKQPIKAAEIPAAQPMWDLVVCDVVSPQGVLRSGVFEELAFLRFANVINNTNYRVQELHITTL